MPAPRDAFRERPLPPHLRMNFLLVDEAGKVLGALAQPGGAAGPARRRLAAALCETVEADERRAQLGVRRAAGEDRQRDRRPTAARVSRRWWTRARAWACAPATPPEAGPATSGARAADPPGAVARTEVAAPLSRGQRAGRAGLPRARGPSAARTGAGRRPRPARRPARPDRDDGVPRGARAAAQRAGVRGPHRGAAGGVGLRRRRSPARCRQHSSELGGSSRRSPKAPPATAADVRGQLAWLAPAGFLLVTPWPRLQDFRRYLQASSSGWRRPGATRAAMRSSRPRPRRSSALSREGEGRARQAAPGEDPYRWLLEEFRVSLFAQQLKTRVTVSARRLQEAWLERERLACGARWPPDRGRRGMADRRCRAAPSFQRATIRAG